MTQSNAQKTEAPQPLFQLDPAISATIAVIMLVRIAQAMREAMQKGKPPK
jgi:hypothetical protein